jgi:hypothetical protein
MRSIKGRKADTDSSSVKAAQSAGKFLDLCRRRSGSSGTISIAVETIIAWSGGSVAVKRRLPATSAVFGMLPGEALRRI